MLLVAFGIFTAGCAILDVEWFMTHRKARLFVDMFGRNGARVIYVIVGAAIALGGLAVG
jgi:hypothetical protein